MRDHLYQWNKIRRIQNFLQQTEQVAFENEMTHFIEELKTYSLHHEKSTLAYFAYKMIKCSRMKEA